MVSLRRVEVAALVLLVGCPSPVEGDGESGDTDASTSGGTSTSGSASEGSLSMTGVSASQTSAGTTTSTTASDESSTTTSGATSASSSSSDGTTAASDPCAGLSREECVAGAGCTAIACRPYVVDGGAGTVCLDEPEYIGCRSSALGCDDARTHTCEGADAMVYVCADSCIPEGWEECMAPGMGVPACA